MIINSWLSGSAKPQGTRYSQSQSWNNDGVWALDTASRREVWESWNSGFKRDNAVRLAGLIAACDADTRELAELEMARDIQRVKQARVSRDFGRAGGGLTLGYSTRKLSYILKRLLTCYRVCTSTFIC